MNKEKYSSIELSILCFILLNSTFSNVTINLFKGMNTSELLISLLAAFILGFPLIIIYKRNIPNDLTKSNILIKLILIINTVILTIFSLYHFSQIIKDILLPDESIYIIYALIILLTSFLAKKGMKSISIAANLFFILNIFIFLITILFNITNIDPINLLPITIKIEKIDFLSIIIYTISPLFLTYIIPINDNKNIKKVYIVFYIYLIIKILFIISILGNKYFSIITYPEITVFKTINIFGLFERIEEILVINIFTTNIILISLAIYYINTLVNSIKNSNKIIYIIPLMIFILLLNIKILNNNILLISNIIFIIINLFIKKRKD